MKKITKYKKPRCDCGSMLHSWSNEIWAVERYISKTGELGNMVKMKTSLDEYGGYDIYLICSRCGNEYESDYDDNNRLIRGELKK